MIHDQDLWPIVVLTKYHLESWLGPHEDGSWVDYYLMRAEGNTTYLYDFFAPDDPDGNRVVAGSFAVTDELGWMGFCATFYGSELHTLSLEVDTEWLHVAEKRWDSIHKQPNWVLVDHPEVQGFASR